MGEHPQAADTLGINVYLMRYAGVLISGFLGGMGGAIFAQSISGRFAITTIAGQGFISMAAMIPVISSIPDVYLQIAPYVLTIVVLVLFLGKASGPKANGTNYIKSK